MENHLGKTGIDTEYEESLLRSAPVFRRPIPISHAIDDGGSGIAEIDRAEDLSLTNTLLGYTEVIKIANEYQSFILKRILASPLQGVSDEMVEGWIESMGATLSADQWLYCLLDIMRIRATRADEELRAQFLIGPNQAIDEIYQGEMKSLNNWKALLGIEVVDGHPIEEPEIDMNDLASYAGLHRQIADIGLVHINRVEDMLEILEIVEQECVSPEATLQDGASYLASFLYDVSATAALAQVKTVHQKRVNELILLMKGMKQVNLNRIKALQEHQDQSFRIRNSYESNILNPMMEVEEGVSNALDDFASILMESAEDASEASGQGLAALMQLFKVEREQLGRLFSKAIDLANTAAYAQLLADLHVNPAVDIQDIESRLSKN